MGMNEAELDAIIREVALWVGAPMTGAWQPRRDRVVLGIGPHFLLMVPRGPHARIHGVPKRPRNPGNPYSFQGACRANLRAPLTGVHKVRGDRALHLRFGARELHLRLTGRSGGLWIVKDGEVLAAYDGPAPGALPALPPPPDAPSATTPRFHPRPSESWNQAAYRWFEKRESDARRRERRLVLTRRLKSRISRDRRLAIALEGDLAKAERAPEARAQADALAARLHTIERGATRVQVPDLDDPDHQWTVELDPRRSPGENLERLYGRARRLDRMGDRVLEHMDRVAERLKVLDGALHIVDEADDATLSKLEKLAPSEGRQRAPKTEELPWYTWIGPHGMTVLVGKNAKANRRLTFQRARGDDFWLHLRGRPGAHLLIPVRSGKTPDLETLLCAAQIALLHAKIPEGEHADVQYTRARHVRSIKGAEDGRVQVLSERVLRVTRDPGVLTGWRRSDLEHFDVDALAEVSGKAGPG